MFFVYFDIVNVGSHLEGPFINPAMKGAHKEHLMRQLSTKGAQEIEEFYGSLDHVSIITLAPELAGENMEAIQQLVKRNIVVSIGKETQYNVFNIYCVIISPDQLFWYESASKLSLAQNRGISLYCCIHAWFLSVHLKGKWPNGWCAGLCTKYPTKSIP